MKSILNTILGLAFGAVLLTAQETGVSVEGAQEFIQSHCIDCHNDRKQKGETNLKPFLQGEPAVDRELLLSVFDQLNLEEMPPEDESQPTSDERGRMLGFLKETIQASGASTIDKKALPGYGNYVDHEALFEEHLADLSSTPTPPRLWRHSPQSFSERVNRIAGHDVIKFVPVATFPVPQKGLKHPAFPYKGPAHTAKDFSNIHDFGLTETELLIGLAEELAAAQLTSGSLREYRNLPPGDAQWSRLLDDQFEKLYSRKPTETERHSLLDLQTRVAKASSIETANQTMISAIYLRPESLFRFEIGNAEAPSDDSEPLTPLEFAHAVGFALNRTGPTPEVVRQFEGYASKDKSALKGLIRPLLDSDEAHQRVLRFMDEYFEYGHAASVFKDKHHRRYRPGWMIEDAERFVSRIIKRDQNVLKELLTSSELSVRGAFNNKLAPKWHQDETNGHLFYHDCYNLEKEDLGKYSEWRDFGNQRAGILTHPAWLIAFSDNTKNHAIQRGRWIQTKLLGGVIPDTPVEVDARFPEDPKLTLREKMQVVRKQECWKCHERMDPLGLPFEQYDLYGKHRTTELDRPVDTTGELNGESVKDTIEMLHRLAGSKRVHQVFLRHVFRFFCGRNETLGDSQTLRDMESAYHRHEGSLNESLLELLVSDSFILRRSSPSKE
jgi:hypothetical protein